MWAISNTTKLERTPAAKLEDTEKDIVDIISWREDRRLLAGTQRWKHKQKLHEVLQSGAGGDSLLADGDL